MVAAGPAVEGAPPYPPMKGGSTTHTNGNGYAVSQEDIDMVEEDDDWEGNKNSYKTANPIVYNQLKDLFQILIFYED